MYKASTKVSFSNSLEVRCTRCSAKLFINPDLARKSLGWECPACGQRH